jgi:hypothetical protein
VYSLKARLKIGSRVGEEIGLLAEDIGISVNERAERR